jgi:glutathione S-transferase
MMLIGMLDSPFVRRVAVSMKLLGVEFEHANWSVGRDFQRILEYSPLGRVPTLVLDDGDTLIESSAILDYLDDLVGAERALLPRSGQQRRDALQLMWRAIGAAEKGRDVVYERVFRPAEKRHEPWLERVRMQMHGALTELEQQIASRGEGRWLIGDRLTQADITTGCALTFVFESVNITPESAPYPALRNFVARCEALPEFQSTKTPWFAPNNG